MELNQIFLYRITHIKNVPHILKYGITHKLSPNSNGEFVSIGDASLIGYRDTKIVYVNDLEITLGNFIPFYFGVRMPMLYVIQHGYNKTDGTKPENIIYLAVSLEKVIEDDRLCYYFSDGHATDFFTKFYDKEDIDKLPEIVDWKAVKERIWSGDGIDTDLKRRKQAEFLIGSDIPLEYIHGYVCYNENAKQQLIEYGIREELIKIFPQAYY